MTEQDSRMAGIRQRLRQFIKAEERDRPGTFARKAGLGASTVHNWIRYDLGGPSLVQLQQIAESYGVRREWLESGEEPMRAASISEAIPGRAESIPMGYFAPSAQRALRALALHLEGRGEPEAERLYRRLLMFLAETETEIRKVGDRPGG